MSKDETFELIHSANEKAISDVEAALPEIKDGDRCSKLHHYLVKPHVGVFKQIFSNQELILKRGTNGNTTKEFSVLRGLFRAKGYGIIDIFRLVGLVMVIVIFFLLVYVIALMHGVKL